MRLASLRELVRTLGIRFHLPRNSTTYHCAYILWLTCGGRPQVRFPRQRGAHYTSLQGAISSSARDFFTSVQSRNSVVRLDSGCIDGASSLRSSESSRTGDAHCVEFTTDCVEVLLTLRNAISMSPQMKAWRFTPRMMQASSLLPLCTNTGSHISEPKSACVPSRRD
jgi:hypothetical protein